MLGAFVLERDRVRTAERMERKRKSHANAWLLRNALVRVVVRKLKLLGCLASERHPFIPNFFE